MNVMRYTATVSRDKNAWTAQCVEHPQAHTWARSLIQLRTAIKEAILLAADLPDDAAFGVDLVADASVPADLADALWLGNRRMALLAEQEQVSASASGSAKSLTRCGYSTRDVAGALAISAGRVSQLVAS